MAVTQRMSEQAYQDLVLTEPVETWELHDGLLVEKPGMSIRVPESCSDEICASSTSNRRSQELASAAVGQRRPLPCGRRLTSRTAPR